MKNSIRKISVGVIIPFDILSAAVTGRHNKAPTTIPIGMAIVLTFRCRSATDSFPRNIVSSTNYLRKKLFYFGRYILTISHTCQFFDATPITFPISFIEVAPTSAMIDRTTSVNSSPVICLGRNVCSTAT